MPKTISSDNHNWVGPFTFGELEGYLLDNQLNSDEAIVWFLNAPGCGWQTPHHCHAIFLKRHLLLNEAYKLYLEVLQKNGGLYLLLDDIGIHEFTPKPEQVSVLNQPIENFPNPPKAEEDNSIYGLIAGIVILILGIVAYRAYNEPKNEQPPIIIKDSFPKQEFAKKILRGDKGIGWEVKPFSNNELVKGLKGKYFEINISEIKARETILFGTLTILMVEILRGAFFHFDTLK